MQIKQLFDDEQAVSPVIGVILMVAITVILAAVIGTFVLGLGDQVQNNTPSAQITFSYDGSNVVTATHEGGDSLTASDLSGQSTDGTTININPNSVGPALTTGEVVAKSDSGLSSSATVRIIWNNPNGQSSTVIAESEAP